MEPVYPFFTWAEDKALDKSTLSIAIEGRKMISSPAEMMGAP
jgi:hypothetical protein